MAKQNGLLKIPLPWAYFICLFLLFRVGALDIFFWSPPSPWPSSSSITWSVRTYIYILLMTKVSTRRFHQLSKTKLGLSSSEFLVLMIWHTIWETEDIGTKQSFLRTHLGNLNRIERGQRRMAARNGGELLSEIWNVIAATARASKRTWGRKGNAEKNYGAL